MANKLTNVIQAYFITHIIFYTQTDEKATHLYPLHI